jgi:hypothetical protein
VLIFRLICRAITTTWGAVTASCVKSMYSVVWRGRRSGIVDGAKEGWNEIVAGQELVEFRPIASGQMRRLLDISLCHLQQLDQIFLLEAIPGFVQ